MLHWSNRTGNINLVRAKQKNWRTFVDEWLTLCTFSKPYDEDWKGWGMFNLGEESFSISGMATFWKRKFIYSG